MGEITDALRRAKSPGKPEPLETDDESAPEAPLEIASYEEPRGRAVAREEPVYEPDELLEDEGVALGSERSGGWQARALVIDGHGAPAEACRHIALRLRRELERRGARSVAVVSALRSEGKTTVACNLALALASLSPVRSVALVDLDLRRPSVASYLRIPCEVGLEELLKGRRGLRRGVAVAVEKPPLDVFPVCVAQPEAHELLAGPAFESLVRALERHYETVVFDTAPVLLVPDATMALRHIAAAVAVARAGRSQRRAFEHMCELLPPEKLVGNVLNEGPLPARLHHYGHYGEQSPESPNASD
jgi:Mrp family chromosome partitioning ATPase